MILREAEQRMKLIADNTTARVFSAKYNTRYLYPYGIQHVGNAYQGSRDTCYELILDSGKNDDSITNHDVIERAASLNADYVMPKDYVGNQSRTRQSMRDFFNLYTSEYQDCAATPFVILQPPYVAEYITHRDFYDTFGHFALGGLQLFDPETQVEELEKFRKLVGPNAYIHALGIGTTLPVIRTLREQPRLINSFDVSTAETAISKNQIPDKKWTRSAFYIPEGIDSTSVRARFSAALLYMLNYMLGTRVTDDIVTAYEDKTTLAEISDWQAVHREALRDEYGVPEPSTSPEVLLDNDEGGADDEQESVSSSMD